MTDDVQVKQGLKRKAEDFEELWKELEQTISNVMNVQPLKKDDWTERFYFVYNLCVSTPEPLCEQLYQAIKTFLTAHVKELHKDISDSSKSVSGQNMLLTTYHECWTNYKNGVNFLDLLFAYLNTQYIKKIKNHEGDGILGAARVGEGVEVEKKLEIGELGLSLFQENLFVPLKDQLVKLLLEAILQDRMGVSINEAVIQGVIKSFFAVEEYKDADSLDFYISAFETPFLTETDVYYAKEAGVMFQGSTCSVYMEKILLKMEGERIRSQKFLHPSTSKKVLRTCETRLVAENLKFLHNECAKIVREDRRKDMKNIYILLKSVADSINVLITEVNEEIIAEGLRLIENQGEQNPANNFVEQVLYVYNKYNDLIKEVFANDKKFMSALHKGCQEVVNKRYPVPNGNGKLYPARAPEYLSRYIDSLMKKQLKGLSETETEEKLQQTITVFTYIEDKDVFLKFYSRMLLKRVIHRTITSMEAEELMVNKLKTNQGVKFISKLHYMFKDIRVAEDLNMDFANFCTNQSVSTMNFSITVLQQGAWPLTPIRSMNDFLILETLQDRIVLFEKFYGGKFTGRKLTWFHYMGNVELKTQYTKRVYILSMGPILYALLNIFSDFESLTFGKLVNFTKVSEDFARRGLQILADNKLVILTTTPEKVVPVVAASNITGPAASSLSQEEFNITDGTVVTLNLDFNSKKAKIKLPPLQARDPQQSTKTEEEPIYEPTDADRKYYLQACIVRIMRSRYKLNHNTLMTEVLDQTRNRFNPSVKMIKEVIERLIEEAYLERRSPYEYKSLA